MVAVKSYEADRFLARPPAHMFLFLVFGTDAGLISERVHRIVAQAVDDPKDPFQMTRLGGDQLAADPLLLADEAYTIPLFGGRKAILIEAGGKGFEAALTPLMNTAPDNCVIVIEAGGLKRDAALRKLCERDKNAAAIECYPDSAKDVAHLIDSEVARAGLSIDADAKTMLVSLLGQDRLTTRSELEKLLLYAHGERHVALEHIEAVVSDASALVFDHAIDGAFDGAFKAVEETASRVFAEGGDANMLLGMALRHALALHRARLDYELAGGSGGEAKARSAYGRAASADRQMQVWSSARLARAVSILAEAIGKVRREPRLAEIVAVRALWAVALAARNKREGE
jgi:DNA polymerase-3 subunit delta